jgi:hypothetical protein
VPAAATHSVQLFGIVSLDGEGVVPTPPGVSVVTFRDVGAMVMDAAVTPPPMDGRHVNEYRRVVETAFEGRTVLPAPFGTVFRSRDSLSRWLELHYFTFLEAMTFVADRLMARVTIAIDDLDADGMTVERPAVDAIATECFRQLKRHTVASLVFPPDSPAQARASFLIERDRWTIFTEAVVEEQKRFADLRVSQSGPWPPYDFVRLQFGG